MARLDRGNEVFVRGLQCTSLVSSSEKPLICRDESAFPAVSEENRGPLGCNISNLLDLLVVPEGFAGYRIVRCRILYVLGYTQSDPEICRTIFQGAIGLRLASTSFASSAHLLKLSLRIMNRRVLSKDEMRPNGLINVRLALLVRIEFASLHISARNLLAQTNVGHFICNRIIFNIKLRL